MQKIAALEKKNPKAAYTKNIKNLKVLCNYTVHSDLERAMKVYGEKNRTISEERSVFFTSS